MKDRKHACALNLGSDSMLPKKLGGWSNLLRSIRKLGQISKHHPRTFQHIRSYPAVVAERQRQLLEEGGHVIHPLSLFSLIWNSLMVVINLLHIMLGGFRLMYVLDPLESLSIHTLDHVLLCLHVVCFVDVVLKLNTGYIEEKESVLVMDRRMIACRYMCRWFVPDVLSCVPLAYILLRAGIGTPRYILIAHLLTIIRIAKMYNVVVDIKVFMMIFTKSYIWCGAVRNIILFVVSVHWCSCLMYLLPVILHYWNGKMPVTYAYFLNTTSPNSLLDYSIETRYNKAIVVSISAFFSTGFTLLAATGPDEFLIQSFIILYAELFMVYILVFLTKSYITMFGATMQYHGLMNEVQTYMKYQQFPAALKKRVLAFYNYTFQGKYFREDTVLKCLSVQLYDEIKMHTCHKLVGKVKLFSGVPASVVGSVLGCLRPEVYLANDLVLNAGDLGDCMYFIATGTVAVYSLKGIEVCHLEDGAHFGEVALLMKDRKRVATVVAVELTQLYRLDTDDFRRFIVSSQMLYKRVEELAAQRMHETVLLDEAFQREHDLPRGTQTPDTTRHDDNYKNTTDNP